jgi:hypothetical protein
MADSLDVTTGHRLVCVFLRALLCALVGGCGHGGVWRSGQAPEAVAAAYAEALQRSDSADARRLLVRADRDALDTDTYARALSRDASEAQELAARLQHAEGVQVTARVRLEDGTSLELELEDGHFHVVDPLTRFYGQGSPREALRSFVRAVQRARWDVVLALMPDVERGELDAATLGQKLQARPDELQRLTAQLSQALEGPIEVVGDRATMPYGESFTARLVREAGLWKVEDPD